MEKQNRTIAERALDFIASGMLVGLGSGRAAEEFVRILGDHRARSGLDIVGVPTSEKTAALARQVSIPLASLAEAMKKGDRPLDVAVDGSDEVDPRLDLIKGYGRAMVREKIVEAAAKKLIILVGRDKLVDRLGARGKLPVEVVPFGVPLCERRLEALGCMPVLFKNADGSLFETDNKNCILDCRVTPLGDPARLEQDIRSIPGVVGTGFFLGMADVVLVGDQNNRFLLVEEKHRERP
jgi:ribose 5-phosphate isomerase A